MKRTIATIIILIALAAGAFGVYRATQVRPDLVEQTAEQLGLAAADMGPTGPLAASGILEAYTLAVSSDLGGRVATVQVTEGDEVAAGQWLLTLDDSLLRPRLAQVDAAVAAAQAQLDLLKAGARPEEIALAEARLAQAQAAATAARQAWDDAGLLRDNPQEMDVQIVDAQTALAAAERQAAAARRLAEAADLQTALWGRVTELLQQGVDVSLPTGGVLHVDNPAERERANSQWNISSQQAWEVWQTAYAADEAARVAATALANLRRARAAPIALDAAVNQAGAASNAAAAAIGQAEAAVAGLRDGARPQEIAVAQQAVEQARAARAPLEVQLAKTQVNAPGAGLVTHVAVHAGEVAVPGAVLVEIADLAELTLTVYIPQPELGQVWLGQPVDVTADAHPGRVFPGLVTRIADQAEFSLRGLQTEDARASAVFAVEINLVNPDGLLKPGMPVDASFAATP
jgi:multidrug resistance efflux pump